MLICLQDGARDDVPAAFWLRETIDPLEALALDLCRGRVLDVGAGAGLHALALQRRGLDVTGIDISPECVAIMRERGVRNADAADLYDFDGGPFDTIVNLCNGLDKVGPLADLAQLQGKYRHDLTANYKPITNDGRDGVTEAVSVMEDSLRLAAMDRWERASTIVDTHVPTMVRGLGTLGALQRVALQMGILFTFVGLMMALSTSAFQSQGEIAGVNLAPLVSALQVAFGSSIAGLIASTAMILTAGVCKHRAQAAIAHLEIMADNILNLSKLLDTAPDVVSDLSTMRTATSNMARDVATMKSTFEATMVAATQAIQALTVQVQTARESQAAYRDFVSKVQKEDLSRSVQEGVAGGIGELQRHVKEAVEASTRLSDTARDLAALQTGQFEKLTAIRNEIARIRRQIGVSPPAPNRSIWDRARGALDSSWRGIAGFGRKLSGQAPQTGDKEDLPPKN
ncbi:MAG TPA: hypothetical protein DCL54_03405 [Alphaproteobacteria bacterium]|nr:hypothetical protein [Alphaproteobacteria bacterium]